MLTIYVGRSNKDEIVGKWPRMKTVITEMTPAGEMTD
jgi:hypothetical protein